MKKLAMVVAVMGMIAMNAGEARAQVSFGAQASYGDDTDFGIGARIYAPLPMTGVRLVGSFDYFFPDVEGFDYFEVNANALYSIPVAKLPAFAPYVGAGLNMARYSVDLGSFGESSDTEMGLNALGGAEFGVGPIKPFAELRIELRDGGQFVLAGGVRF